MPRNYCPHERLSRYKRSENLVGLIVAATGRPSTGKTALAREIAKALRCTFLEYNMFHSIIPAGAGLTSEDDPAYQILWKMIETHLDDRNHHIVIDSPLSRRVELDRLLGIAKSHDAVVILIDCVEPTTKMVEWYGGSSSGLMCGVRIPPESYLLTNQKKKIDCVAGGQDKLRGRLGVRHDDREGEETLARDLERSLTMEEEQEDDRFYYYDLSKIDIPKLTIETTSGAELDEQIESVKKLILTSLDEKFTIVEGDGTMRSRCSRCTMDAVRRRFATFPKTFKHELHGDEFHLRYSENSIAKGNTFSYMCGACLLHGKNLYYSWGGLCFHPECVLELPLQVTHKCHWHALKLTLLPPKDETDEYYCEVCAGERDADNWIYYCRGCEYEAHIPCVVPHLPGDH